ncbi:MAG TPA: Fur family transcriptional regulator [Thermodesulfobacteriota bacterium]|nr:Fur family transcriptional regulator [Thermodesulfobacteriota bacterium]
MMNIGLLRNVFREKKLSLSYPRLLIYQELSNASGSLSPLEIYQSLLKKKKKIGLTSIYRSLELFESLGMVFKIVNGSSVKYKLCELENHHHHIVCKACGNVVELNFCDISDWSKKVTESTGYQVVDHELNFYGFCQSCKPLQTLSDSR